MLMFFFALMATAPSAQAAPAGFDAVPQTRLDASVRCHLGTYRMNDGQYLTINGDNGQARGFQYTRSNGQFGRLAAQPDGSFGTGTTSVRFQPCAARALEVNGAAAAQLGTKLAFVERETQFLSNGVRLHGKLVLPPNGRANTIAVWIEGSNNNPSTDDNVWQYELARRGIGVFTYDKRGTGASAGELSSDFHVRARDTAAAVAAARTLAPNVRRVGVIGASQGGWVAPLTATLVPLDFVVTAYGLAQSPIAQDQALVEQQVQSAGFGAVEMEAARNLTKITEQIVRSNLESGFTELEAFKREHGDAAWVQAIQPRSYTGFFLRFSSDDIKLHGPALSQGLTFDFEPRPIVERIGSRQLWLLAGRDTQAPNAGTQAVLREIQRKRTDVSVVVFPRADHGLIEPDTSPERSGQILSAQQFDVTANWISYGRSPSKDQFVRLP